MIYYVPDDTTCGSHSARSAWIEIDLEDVIYEVVESRTPHGVRGLKSDEVEDMRKRGMSHSARSAWIEILS